MVSVRCLSRNDIAPMHAISLVGVVAIHPIKLLIVLFGEAAYTAPIWGTVVSALLTLQCIPLEAEQAGERAQTVISVHRPEFLELVLGGYQDGVASVFVAILFMLGFHRPGHDTGMSFSRVPCTE